MICTRDHEGMDVGESSDIQEGDGGGIPEFRESSGPTQSGRS